MKTNLFLYFIFFISLISCSYGGSVLNEEQKNHANNCTLVFSGIKEFDLDDETSYTVPYIQLIDADTATYFSFHNTYNNSIYFYDYDSSNLSKRIHYEKEGNNGVGDIQGYFYLNDDSIFIYSYWGHILFLTNADGKVLSKKKIDESLDRSSGIIYSSPYPQTSTPIKKNGSNIIFAGFIAGETTTETEVNRPVGILYDFNAQTSNYVINYPPQYAKYNWGGGFTYRIPYFDVDEQSMIISFSADHYLVKYSLATGTQERHYAGSSSIKKIKSYSYPKDVEIDENRAWEWYMKNPSYQSVFYDKYEKMYYRIARLPVKDYNLGDNGNKKPKIIIVLDANLNYLGEVTLPNDINYEFTNCFVSRDGLNIQVINENEDKLIFYQYNFFLNEK
jgi:hypothetical protein